jgi:hypothetical protein
VIPDVRRAPDRHRRPESWPQNIELRTEPRFASLRAIEVVATFDGFKGSDQIETVDQEGAAGLRPADAAMRA